MRSKKSAHGARLSSLPISQLSGDPRRAALLNLADVLTDTGRHERRFDEDRVDRSLSPRDRAFARLLVATTLRHLGQIDPLIDRCLARPLSERYQRVRQVLRLGVAQIIHLGTPAHAAVDTSVALTKWCGLASHAPLVNAVLRRIAVADPEWIPSQGSVRANTPAWMWQALVHAYGEDVTEAIARVHEQTPPLDLTVKRHEEAPLLAQALGADLLPTGTLRLHHAGAVADLPGYAEGQWWVQDAAASLPARLLGSVVDQQVIDLCAAPGGKTAQLAAAGARVIAVDSSEERLKRLSGNLERLNLTAMPVCADALCWRPDSLADRLLLDAPCSATGTVRRHPDVPFRRHPDQIPPMTQLQRDLLHAAVNMLKPGGIMVYSTCSLLPDECEGVVDAILSAGAPLRRVPLSVDELPELAEALTPAGDLRTLPCHWASRGGIDGFYVARLQRA